MPIVQTNIRRVNRVIENILDQPIVIRVMSPMQPIANTITTRYLDYAIPGRDDAPAGRPVAYSVVDASGEISWDGDTNRLADHPEQRQKTDASAVPHYQPISYSIIDATGNTVWEGDTNLLPGYLSRNNQ